MKKTAATTTKASSVKTHNKNDNENENIAEFMMCHWRSIISLYHVYS